MPPFFLGKAMLAAHTRIAKSAVATDVGCGTVWLSKRPNGVPIMIHTNRTHEAGIVGYAVTNRRTGQVTWYKSGAAALRAVDRIDNAHGGYIASRRAIWSDDAEAARFAD